VAIGFRARTLGALRSVFNDALYRGSATLLVNTAATSAIGFVFWTLAARSYPATAVGAFSGLISGAGLLAAIAALGLPNTMIRHIVGAENPRQLVVTAFTAIATVGTAVCLITILALGPHLPPALHLQQRGRIALLLISLVVLTAVGGTFDAGLIATRSSHVVLVKNLIGSVVKVAALIVLTSFRSSGLLLAYSLGLVLATVLSGIALGLQIRGKGTGSGSFRALRRYLSLTSANYVATVMGILPLSVVPLEVLAIRGAADTARFAMAFLIAGFLNFIPSTAAQVLFAEASRKGVPLGRQLRKALRGVYGLLLPASVVMIAAAPLLLRIFGPSYATGATGCLRVLALSALLTGGTYLVDSLLIARDRTWAYVFMNGANAALVLTCVGMLLPRGLTAAAVGWALGQGISLVLGLLVVATGTVGRHHPRISPGRAEHPPRNALRDGQPPSVIRAPDPEIRKLLATWPMMPTTLIAEKIGWDQPISVLVHRVTELRPTHPYVYQHLNRTEYLPGETAQCGLWFPPIELPVGFGQTRSAGQLPVLTMVACYSRWLSAKLIPSRHANDLFTGLWELLTTFGAVPRVLTWDSDGPIGRWQAGKVEHPSEYGEFCHALGAKIVTGKPAEPQTRELIERAHVDLERSFLPGRTFASPMDFDAQLGEWLDAANIWGHQPPDPSPTELISADKQAMLPLPTVPPPTGWRLSMKVGSRPFFRFDSNDYSVHPAAIGCRVELVADLSRIKVRCDGRMAADHERIWAREQVISDPAHVSAQPASFEERSKL
jgi:O-antigen/teichoic acid export membrane protein